MKALGRFVNTMVPVVGYGLFVIFSLVLMAPEWMSSRVRVSLHPTPIYTREECAALWSQGSTHVVGMGEVPLKPLMEWLEVLRSHTFTRDGVLVNQPPQGAQP